MARFSAISPRANAHQNRTSLLGSRSPARTTPCDFLRWQCARASAASPLTRGRSVLFLTTLSSALIVLGVVTICMANAAAARLKGRRPSLRVCISGRSRLGVCRNPPKPPWRPQTLPPDPVRSIAIQFAVFAPQSRLHLSVFARNHSQGVENGQHCANTESCGVTLTRHPR